MTEYLKTIKKALEDKKSENIVIIDIHEISVMADYFVIASGSNVHQVQAMSDSVCDAMAKAGCHIRATEGYESGNWILLDYGDIIVHLFDRESRSFYDLERLWTDGKTVNL